MTTIQPLFDNVLIKPLEAEEKLPSGILLPDSAKEKPQTGIVIAVGPGNPMALTATQVSQGAGGSSEMKVSPGDKVIYKKWGGNEIKSEGQIYMMVEQKDILAIIK